MNIEYIIIYNDILLPCTFVFTFIYNISIIYICKYKYKSIGE